METLDECKQCPVNAKCGICEIYINWIKEHKKTNE